MIANGPNGWPTEMERKLKRSLTASDPNRRFTSMSARYVRYALCPDAMRRIPPPLPITLIPNPGSLFTLRNASDFFQSRPLGFGNNMFGRAVPT